MKKIKNIFRTHKLIAIIVVAVVMAIGITLLVLARAATATLVINDNITGDGVNQWQYTGTNWQYYTDGGNKYQGDDHGSSAAGDYATLKFKGIKAEYYGAKSPQAGIVAISIDNGTETMVDLYSATHADNALIFTTPTLSDGDHTLKIRLTGNKNPSASAAAAAVDRAVVTYNDASGGRFFNLEAESGSAASPASVIADSSASGGNAVRFQAAATPPPTPPSGSLPSKIVGAYWQMYEGPKVSEITANAPNYDVQYASFARGSNTNGNVSFDPAFQSGQSLINDIAASKASGDKWLISLGGGGDSNIRLMNETHATNMYNSLVSIIDTYGFQGIDFDLECGTSCLSPDAGVSLVRKLKAKYGSSFIISAVPRPYETRSSSGVYAQLALKLGNDLDLYGLQFYDFPETRNTAQLTSMINNDIAAVVNMGIPPSKILIGAITYQQYNLGWNTVDVYKNIFLQQEQKYPALRGVFIWESSLDKKENWSFSKVMGPAVH